MANRQHVVTGAFSFSGRHIARRLLDRGDRLKTLTNHPGREHPFGEAIPAYPLAFDEPDKLQLAMQGADTLFNTYWIRFPRGDQTFEKAVSNTQTLLAAARRAGVRRVVHFSIVNAAEDSPLHYFRAKAQAEEVVRKAGISYAILRPTILFGSESILFNNIAWLLRRFPVFALAGKGDYRLQPVAVEDLAELAVTAADEEATALRDVAGPEILTFADLVKQIARATGSRARLLRVKPERMLGIINRVSGIVEDPVITREELEGLTREMLISEAKPLGRTRLSAWLEECGRDLGYHYASAIKRHYR